MIDPSSSRGIMILPAPGNLRQPGAPHVRSESGRPAHDSRDQLRHPVTRAEGSGCGGPGCGAELAREIGQRRLACRSYVTTTRGKLADAAKRRRGRGFLARPSADGLAFTRLLQSKAPDLVRRIRGSSPSATWTKGVAWRRTRPLRPLLTATEGRRDRRAPPSLAAIDRF